MVIIQFKFVNDTILEVRKRTQYEKPRIRRNRAKAAAKKREQKRVSETAVIRKRMF